MEERAVILGGGMLMKPAKKKKPGNFIYTPPSLERQKFKSHANEISEKAINNILDSLDQSSDKQSIDSKRGELVALLKKFPVQTADAIIKGNACMQSHPDPFEGSVFSPPEGLVDLVKLIREFRVIQSLLTNNEPTCLPAGTDASSFKVRFEILKSVESQKWNKRKMELQSAANQTLGFIKESLKVFVKGIIKTVRLRQFNLLDKIETDLEILNKKSEKRRQKTVKNLLVKRNKILCDLFGVQFGTSEDPDNPDHVDQNLEISNIELMDERLSGNATMKKVYESRKSQLSKSNEKFVSEFYKSPKLIDTLLSVAEKNSMHKPNRILPKLKCFNPNGCAFLDIQSTSSYLATHKSEHKNHIQKALKHIKEEISRSEIVPNPVPHVAKADSPGLVSDTQNSVETPSNNFKEEELIFIQRMVFGLKTEIQVKINLHKRQSLIEELIHTQEALNLVGEHATGDADARGDEADVDAGTDSVRHPTRSLYDLTGEIVAETLEALAMSKSRESNENLVGEEMHEALEDRRIREATEGGKRQKEIWNKNKRDILWAEIIQIGWDLSWGPGNSSTSAQSQDEYQSQSRDNIISNSIPKPVINLMNGPSVGVGGWLDTLIEEVVQSPDLINDEDPSTPPSKVVVKGDASSGTSSATSSSSSTVREIAEAVVSVLGEFVIPHIKRIEKTKQQEESKLIVQDAVKNTILNSLEKLRKP